jgi:hypothetical protein
MDSVLRRLMSRPCAPLDVQFNGVLLRIFEAFLSLRDERDTLQARLDVACDERKGLVAKFEIAQCEWHRERDEYRAEVKKLEVLLARTGEHGVKEVMLARQESLIRRPVRPHRPDDENIAVKENVMEVLDRTLSRDRQVWSKQRGNLGFHREIHSAGDIR